MEQNVDISSLKIYKSLLFSELDLKVEVEERNDGCNLTKFLTKEFEGYMNEDDVHLPIVF